MELLLAPPREAGPNMKCSSYFCQDPYIGTGSQSNDYPQFVFPAENLCRHQDFARIGLSWFHASPLLSRPLCSDLRSGCFRPRISKGSDRRASSIDVGDFRKLVEQYIKTPRVVDLGHQGHIRKARPVAKAERFSFHQGFDRAEAFLNPVP